MPRTLRCEASGKLGQQLAVALFRVAAVGQRDAHRLHLRHPVPCPLTTKVAQLPPSMAGVWGVSSSLEAVQAARDAACVQYMK